MKSKLFGWLTLVVALIYSSALLALESTPANQKSPQDGKLLAWIIVVDNIEIAAGKLALKESKNPEVIKYAHELVNDHSKNLNQAKALSHRINAKLIHSSDTTDSKEKGKELMTKLKDLKGTDFDKAYIDAMVDGHTSALSYIDTQISQLPDSKLHNFAKQTRDTIQKHLTDGKAIQQKMAG